MVVGDLGKNSLGLVWLAALLWRLHVWLEERKMINVALVVAFLSLLGLTHIGVFGWALALAGLTMMVALWRSEPLMRCKLLPWLLVGSTACSLAAGLVLWKFDPARVHRLTNALTHPLTFLGNDQGKHGGQPVITLAAADELRSLADDISAPKKTLIVARVNSPIGR